MNDGWWRGKDQLDGDQRNVITLPEDKSYLVVGPPGSGKTNLLVLRANFMYLADKSNILIILFTRSLRDFIATGGAEYAFPDSKVVTCRKWQQDLLREHGISYADAPSGNFEKERTYFMEKVGKLLDQKGLSNQYDAIFLDEAQDYLPEEIQIFRRLAKVLFCVADSRQKIYGGEDSLSTIESLVDGKQVLTYHYRNGLPICSIADGIAKHNDEYVGLSETSRYDAKAYPPIVEHHLCSNLDEQMDKIFERLEAQMAAYPGHLIGVICPTGPELTKVWSRLSASHLGSDAMLQRGRDRDAFDGSKQICVSTYSAAKGLEFRALHMAACDSLKSFPYNRNLAYTSVTRAKTSLSLYYSGSIHGYLESALKSLEPESDLPDLDDVFRGKR